jgi:hypothetical protein
VSTSNAPRRHQPSLLSRPPSGIGDRDLYSGRPLVDPVAQLSELADLLRRGLLSIEEFQVIKARVVGLDSA